MIPAMNLEKQASLTIKAGKARRWERKEDIDEAIKQLKQIHYRELAIVHCNVFPFVKMQSFESKPHTRRVETARTGDEFQFESKGRKRPKFGDKFPEPTFTDLGIYLPECWIDGDGYEVKLLPGGVPAAAIEPRLF
jgi:hypothetical protein